MNYNWEITPTLMVQTLAHLVFLIVLLVRMNDATKRNEERAGKQEEASRKLEEKFNEFKIEVAREYASKSTMAEALKPLLDELHALRDRIDKLIDRRS